MVQLSGISSQTKIKEIFLKFIFSQDLAHSNPLSSSLKILKLNAMENSQMLKLMYFFQQ